jgi:Uma2 family endonuclease
MTTLAAQPPVLPTPAVRTGGHFVFENVDWEYYEQTLRALEETHVRVTYDRGRMELMSPLPWHEYAKRIAARMVDLYALEARVSVTAYGSVTCKHRPLEKGVEPDDGYYVQTPAPPPTKEHFDFSKVPPPDLAIEVDVTTSSIPRQPIYAALGVAEIWRLTESGITPLLRSADGTYEVSPVSKAFPELDVHQFNHFLQLALTGNQQSAVESFRDWVRSTHQS